MRNIISGMFFLLFMSTGFMARANTTETRKAYQMESDSTVTTTFSVNGTEGCKSTIEAILKNIDGVQSAVWNVGTKKITVVYDAQMVQLSLLYLALKEGGFDNQGGTSTQKAYDLLPPECKYTR